ncbi:MAG: hydrogenase formation protein HypD [Coriobacteriales bacterium]|jgi:hydrogenase expression/formation protein HypD|nr:hydrogenase formation protein HypD [Coriobacteriales bacterium]
MEAVLLERFKDPALARELIGTIETLAQLHSGSLAEERPLRLMEVCGSHTVAIAKSGIASVLPHNIQLISGPGCPVCVTAGRDVDRIIALTKIPNVTLTTFGDMLRVPGSTSSLQQQKAHGAHVEVVYSPLDALALAAQDPSGHYVFVGVGFETTTPLVAATIQRAAARGLDNFTVLAVHKQVPPALNALAVDDELALDGLILPGHVSTILGVEPFVILAEHYGIPAVICGFEPVDILLAINMLLVQITRGQAQIEIAYSRAVNPEGNPTARCTLSEVFDVCDASWRGLGFIPNSGHCINAEYAAFDAGRRFDVDALTEPTVEPKGCRCGSVLRGALRPSDCPLFGKPCTPANPIGPCMVSSEGSCAASYSYQLVG